MTSLYNRVAIEHALGADSPVSSLYRELRGRPLYSISVLRSWSMYRLMQMKRIACIGLILILTIITLGQEPNRVPVPEKDYIVEPIDTYGALSWEDERARLDNFAIRLVNAPKLIGYITVYAANGGCAGEAQAHGMRAKKYLVEHRGVDWNRVIWKDAGYLSETYVMLWGQVRGAEPYPFYQPKSLPPNTVKTKNCPVKVNQSRKQVKSSAAQNKRLERTRHERAS
jgi:hypothetical protein